MDAGAPIVKRGRGFASSRSGVLHDERAPVRAPAASSEPAPAPVAAAAPTESSRRGVAADDGGADQRRDVRRVSRDADDRPSDRHYRASDRASEHDDLMSDDRRRDAARRDSRRRRDSTSPSPPPSRDRFHRSGSDRDDAAPRQRAPIDRDADRDADRGRYDAPRHVDTSNAGRAALPTLTSSWERDQRDRDRSDVDALSRSHGGERVHRRVYVGGLPPVARLEERDVERAVNAALAGTRAATGAAVAAQEGDRMAPTFGAVADGLEHEVVPVQTVEVGAEAEYRRCHPVLAVQLFAAKRYAFVDVRSRSLAAAAVHPSVRVVMDGVRLTMKRPHDYPAPPDRRDDRPTPVHPREDDRGGRSDAPVQVVDPSAPSVAFARSFQPQAGASISLSNFKKNANLISSGLSVTSGVVTQDVMAALKARLAAAAPAPSTETVANPAEASAALEMFMSGRKQSGMTTGGGATAAAAAAMTGFTHSTNDAGVVAPAAAAVHLPFASTAGNMYKHSSAAATGVAEVNAATAHVDFETAVRTAYMSNGTTSATLTTLATVHAGGDTGERAAAAAASIASIAASLGVPLLGSQSAVTSVPFPNNAGGGNVNIGTTPAAAAGLLGPSGIMVLLASISPTRILVLLNALTDEIVRNDSELADVIADLVIEANAAAAGKGGRVLACRVPQPQKPGETVDVVFTRPVKVPALAGAYYGGVGLLEDRRAPDRSRVMAADTATFFTKALGKKGEHIGLLVDGAGTTAFGAAGASYAMIADAPAGFTTNGDGDAPAPAPAPAPAAPIATASSALVVAKDSIIGNAGAGEGDDGAGYDPLAGRTRGLGKVFIECSDVAAAVAIQQELSGRSFDGRILVTSFADEARYTSGELCEFGACFPLPIAPTAVPVQPVAS